MEWIKWKRGGEWVDNDEGYHYAYCYTCASKTEHDLRECIPCGDRAARRAVKVRSVAVSGYEVRIYPNGNRYCSCKGFQFRKTCKHIGMVSA